MSAPDDISLLMGKIPETERELRQKLRGYRNAASAMIASTDCPTARRLAWFANDYAAAVLYAPMSEEGLAEIGKFARRMMVCAMQAEAISDEVEHALAR